jgi:hypothetical protein
MGGFDKARSVIELGLPEGYRPEAAIAVGRRADKSILPETIRAREVPNSRNPQADFVFEGGFSES